MRSRRGFTLVEMLVSMALTLFVMVILSQAFIAALDTFSGLKSIGDMDEGLRTLANNLRADLQHDHFNGSQRLSTMSSSPGQGFFAIYQGALGVAESADWEGMSTYPTGTAPARLTATHRLHFTVRTRGNRPEHFFSANVPAGSNLLTKQIDSYPNGSVTPFGQSNTVTSRWAEVAYFLLPQGTTDSPNQTGGTGTALYKLYRSQFLVVTDRSQLGGTLQTNPPTYENVSCLGTSGNPLSFFAPDDQAGKDATPVTLTDITGNGTTATATSAAAHGYATNDIVRISGSGTAAFNGIFVITVNTATTFTYGCAVAGNDTNALLRATRLQAMTSPPTLAARRFNPAVPDATGATLLLSNVVSFAVQPMRVGDADFGDLGVAGYDAMFDTAGDNSPFARRPPGQPASPVVSLNYQNNSSGVSPLPSLSPTPINGLQISVRVWDPKTKGSRQITIIQDM